MAKIAGACASNWNNIVWTDDAAQSPSATPIVSRGKVAGAEHCVFGDSSSSRNQD
jgi:hypothetical protein